jgi:Ca-activated chloride channel family protein
MVIAWIVAAMAVAAMAVAGMAEWMHWLRCRRIARLAFGAAARPMRWLAAGAVLRALAVAALGWGLFVLLHIGAAPWDPAEASDGNSAVVHRLVIALDVSPSMQLADAGATRDQRRAQRAKDVLRPLVERINWRRTRVSVVAFYSTARPVVIDTFDPEVLNNILDDLPMEHAFQAGKTNLYEGVKTAAEIARAWPVKSASLIVVSDGDTLPEKGLPAIPAAFAMTLILGLGNPQHGIFIDGHSSRQDAESLTRLALRLGGVYHDANLRDVTSDVTKQLEAAIPVDRRHDPSLREAAMTCVVSGAAVIALLPVLFSLVARRWKPQWSSRDETADDAELPRPRVCGAGVPPARNAAETAAPQEVRLAPAAGRRTGEP